MAERFPFSDLKKLLKNTLSAERYRHSLAVAELAASLAQRHGWNPALAERAGLLHDCAKEWSPVRLIRTVRRNKIKIPDFDFIIQNAPNLLHAYVSAHVAQKNRWLRDRQALRAIASHTLGDVRMTIPQMILFVADFAAKNRQYPSADEVRRLARRHLKPAFRAAMSKKIKWNLNNSKPVHPFAVKVWNAGVRP